MKSASRSYGFTLIELAISLTIISLIIGSVFSVKKIRDNQVLHSIMADANKLNTAFNNFKLAYKALPGDMYNAVEVFGNVAAVQATSNGNGNDLIDNSSVSNIATTANNIYFNFQGVATASSSVYEGFLALQHLAIAGYIKGFYTGNVAITTGQLNYMPSVVNKGNDGFYFGSTNSLTANTVFTAGSNSTNNSLIVYARIIDFNADNSIAITSESTYGVLSPADSYKIDQKYDDGLPLTGRIVAANGNITTNDHQVTGSCVNTVPSPYIYNYSNSSEDCYLGIIIDQ